MIPIIGVPSRCRKDSADYPPLNGAFVDYLDAIVAAGGAPIIIPLIEEPEILERIFDQCSGMLFTGGEDICPSFYGEVASDKLGGTDEQRDRVELRLMEWTLREKKPVLGICRGMQLLNVARGGTLFQDIHAERPGAPEHRVSGWSELSHRIDLVSDSRLARELDTASLEVNSLHHQAVKAVGEGLVVTASSHDDLVEAIEGNAGTFTVGVQCHPEMLWREVDPRWRRVFEALVKEAR